MCHLQGWEEGITGMCHGGLPRQTEADRQTGLVWFALPVGGPSKEGRDVLPAARDGDGVFPVKEVPGAKSKYEMSVQLSAQQVRSARVQRGARNLFKPVKNTTG